MPPINARRLLDRFLRYVAVDTTACDTADVYPSCPGQLDLGRLLVEELRQLGLADAHQDEHGLVWASIPGAPSAPAIALNAHLDTSPESSGANVKPQVVENYQGGDIPLGGPAGPILRAADYPELAPLTGCTLVTTDGATLLGGDDKAGVAVIMETAACLIEQPELPHGPLRILFTCDEEIGRGVQHVDLKKLDAVACYTLDGRGANEIDVETFSADLATIVVRGVNIHPSIAKGEMANALKAAAELIDRLPRDRLSPETTEGREGFLHPYHIEGGVGQVTLKILLRDFDAAALRDQERLLHAIARQVESQRPGVSIRIRAERQYRNMAQALAADPRAVAFAEEAHRRLGRTAQRTIIRGGTDGAQLTEKGLPTPNLSSGQHNPHSPLEWVCLDQMVQAVEVLLQLVQVWAQHADPPPEAAPS